MKSETVNPNTIVWFEGSYVHLREANVNVLTHALNYGTGVFEGIRGYYDQPNGELYLLRAREHFERWKKNCSLLRIDVPETPEALTEITAELCRRNRYSTNVYVRPLAYKSAARLGVAIDDQNSYCITTLPFGEYFGGRGIKAGISSWRRIDDNAIPSRAKICGAYVNSALAGDEVRRNGHDEAIFLTQEGHVAEGASCNLFMVRNGKLITPPPSDNILEGITRASVMELARRELRLEVVERSIDRSELYICDEVFFTGTAVEIVPVIAIDHRPVGTGAVSPVTSRLLELYRQVTHGRLPAYGDWLQPVYQRYQFATQKSA